MSKISIQGLSKAAVLAALYNASKPQGLGFMHYDSKPMTEEVAQQVIDEQGLKFDYLKGRVMKVDISQDELNVWGFDRDNGAGAAQSAIDVLCKTGDVNDASVAAAHKTATVESAKDFEKYLGTPTTLNRSGNATVMTLGVDDELAEQVSPRLKKVIGGAQ